MIVKKIYYINKPGLKIWKKDEPIITEYKGEPYTKITFLPDYKRFGVEGLTDDLYSIFVKRVYDCALWFSGNMNIEMDTKKKIKFTNECIFK